MSRNHRTPFVVRIICTDSFHDGEAKLPHVIQTLKAEHGFLLPWHGQGIKPFRDGTGNRTHRLTCTCGRDPQMRSYNLFWKAMPLFYATQVTRVDLDITTL